MARSGLTCGAVTGAVIAIGAALGRDGAEEDREPAYDAARRLVAGFQSQFGTTSCRDLTGIDLTTPEGRQAWIDRGLEEKCAEMVGWAVEEVLRLSPPRRPSGPGPSNAG